MLNVPRSGGDTAGSLDIRHCQSVAPVLRDRSAHRTVRDPGSDHRRDLHRRPGVGILFRGGSEKREEHGLGGDQVRSNGDRVGDRHRALHRGQHEPG